MSYSSEQIEQRLRLGEDSRWEFKQVEFAADRPKGPSRTTWADEIAAFANAKGGVLICGVTDDGEVQGMSREQAVALDALLVEVSTDTVKPAVRIETHHRELASGERVLVVEVPKGDAQHDSPGGSFVRVGGSKRRMTSDERLRLAQRRSQARYLWFDEQPLPGTGFGTLEESLWKPLLSAEGRAAPEAALRRLALLADDEAGVPRATVAGVLFCTGAPERFLPGASITATRYLGNDRASAQGDAQEIAGPLDRQIAEAMAFARRNMRVAARKTPARVDLPQYSERALFEAVVNAVVHRDYSRQGSRIRLSMFEDRVEIQSPGSLPNNLSLESLGDRQATRNEALTSVFRRMPVAGIPGSDERRYFMERRGDGVPIILRETRELSGRLPEYRLIDDADLRLTIPSASQEASAAAAVITVRSSGGPVAGADVLALFPNRTWKRAETGENGEATVDLHSSHLPMTVFVAAQGCGAHVEREWTPRDGALAVELQPLGQGGSAIFPEATGHLPGLCGRLNPIRDAGDRTYLYASNVAINEGSQQPVHFTPGEEMRLADAEGNELAVRVVEIVGRSALLEYRSEVPVAPSGAE